MPRFAPCLLVVVACTGAAPRPMQPVDTTGATSPWQERCGQRVGSAAAEAGDPRLADAAVSFAELHGDNFTYFVVTLRGASPQTPALQIDRKHLPLADEHASGWRREEVAARVRWRREDGITRAELDFPATTPPTEATRERLLAAADACIADAFDPPGAQ